MENSKLGVSACLAQVDQARVWLLDRLSQANPWRGLTTLPCRPDGTEYVGTNVFLLWMHQDNLGSSSSLWGSKKSLAQLGMHVRDNAKPSIAIYFADFDGRMPTAGVIQCPADKAAEKRLMQEMEPAGQRVKLLKPISLYNEAQTEGFRPSKVTAPIRQPSTDAQIGQFSKFCDEFLVNRRMQPENQAHPLTAQDEVFLKRFASDMMQVSVGLIHACDIQQPYPAAAIEAITRANSARVMKLGGIASEICANHAKKMKPVTRQASKAPTPPAQTVSPPMKEHKTNSATASLPTPSRDSTAEPIPVSLDW